MYIIISLHLLSDRAASLYITELVDIHAFGSQVRPRQVDFLHELCMRLGHIIKRKDSPAQLE